ncbi:MAG: N-acetylneuraminate synthase [Colwellia sp.]|nr:N-acetylneuraminate synthase [Colwellia sp.]
MISTLIIAEAGVNHNGSEELAFKLVDAAIDAGVDIIKFQTFKADELVTSEAKQADYQIKNTEKAQSQWSMLKELELSYDSHMSIKSYCDSKNIEYLSTAFDSLSLKFLTETMCLTRLKIPSGEINNAPFVLEHALTGCEIILSTGMSTLPEIEFALAVLAYGFTHKTEELAPSHNAFVQAYHSKEGQAQLKKKVTLLHCTTEYPAPFSQVNLKAMDLMADTFELPIGYSDHTSGISVSLAAVAREACVIEKHFTLDRNMQGPDHKASIEPDELKALVTGIREIEVSLGQAVKVASICEEKNKAIARKSIIAKKEICKGEMLTEKNLMIKRPGTGISPNQYYEILGSKAVDNFKPEQLIRID